MMIDEPLYPVAGLTSNDDPRAFYTTLNLMLNIFHRNELNEGQRLIWLWMVIQCAQANSTLCCFSYQQMAGLIRWKVDAIHRALHQLRRMGYLLGNVPCLHGIVTDEDAQVLREFTPTLPEHEKAIKRQIEINLIREQLKKNPQPYL